MIISTRKKVNIYLNTLFKVISSNYETCFRNLIGDDVDLFNAKTKIIASYGREDAHAKSISENEFQMFRTAMTWLKGVIEDNE